MVFFKWNYNQVLKFCNQFHFFRKVLGPPYGTICLLSLPLMYRILSLSSGQCWTTWINIIHWKMELEISFISGTRSKVRNWKIDLYTDKTRANEKRRLSWRQRRIWQIRYPYLYTYGHILKSIWNNIIVLLCII